MKEIESTDSLEQIALDLSKNYKSYYIKQEIQDKQTDLFDRIKNQAKTGGEFYALNLIVRKEINPYFHFRRPDAYYIFHFGRPYACYIVFHQKIYLFKIEIER